MSPSEKLGLRFFALFMIAFGLACIYVSFTDFLENQFQRKQLSESETADLKSIQESPNQAAMTEAVNRLMARPDIARVSVLRGDYAYPSYEITLAKNSRPAEIERHVKHNEKGFWIYIGYNTPSKIPAWGIRDSIRSVGCFLGGVLLIGFSLVSVFFPPEKVFQRTHEERPKPHPTTHPEAETKTTPVRYEGPRLVK
jgi:hypothetical protein